MQIKGVHYYKCLQLLWYFLAWLFYFFWVTYDFLDPIAKKNVVNWVNSFFGLGSHSFSSTSHWLFNVGFFIIVLLGILMFPFAAIIANGITYIEDCTPLDEEQCKVAVKFFKKHPEYVYFLEEVRKQGRQMLFGELKALQSEAEEQKKNSGCKELYNRDIRSI